MKTHQLLKRFALLASILLLLVLPGVVSAQDDLTLVVSTDVVCDQAQFNLDIYGGDAPYMVRVDFGDGEEFIDTWVVELSIEVQHTYPGQAEYEWSIFVEDAYGLIGESEGTISLDGPTVSISSDPFPPLLTIEQGEAGISFSADVSGGTLPYTLAWDLDGDGIPDDSQAGETAEFSYSEAGEYVARVEVVDGCGFAAGDSLTVVVVDPERDPENACHPTALKIAEAVSSIFPDRAEQIYTCKDIFDIFEGAIFGYQVGFGRMWHAYQLTQRIDELSWEDILDWQLNYSGWGVLQQLNRFADLLDSLGISDLLSLVTSGEQTIGEIRSAVRAVTRYDADFEDALARINAGATNGELGQLYKLAGELEVEPVLLDEYLVDGWTIQELNHAAKAAARVGADWEEIVQAKTLDLSWGEIGQAYKLANAEFSATDIMAIGVKEFRTMERDQAQSTRQAERTLQTALKLAGQYDMEPAEVLALYNGDCAGSWGCVRQTLHDKRGADGELTDRDERTAAKIASQYGYSEPEVWQVFKSSCGSDWTCVRTYFRELTKGSNGKGKTK